MKKTTTLFFAGLVALTANAQITYDETTPVTSLPTGVYYQNGPGGNNTLNWTYPYSSKLTVNGGLSRNFELASLSKANEGFVIRQFDQTSNAWTGWKKLLLDDGNGSVGIGTNTPKSKMHIFKGVSGGTPHSFSTLSIEDDSNAMVSILTPNDKTAYFGFADSDDNYVGGMQYSHSTNALIFRANNHNSDMVIDSNGNVGIGTTTPGDYKLAVAGTTGIIAEKVTVKVKESWPDYVFEEDYNLPSLEEVEKHIKEKGHLENIPSAKQMEESDGIDLGAMNTKLLQKIEELTLYTIQQEKKIEKLADQNKQLIKENKRIDILEEKVNAILSSKK